jgi:hypothetical protein
MKPFKFAFSFAVFFATIAVIETRLSEPVRNGWTLRIIGWIMAAAVLSEMAYMMYQAGRSEASHFNYSTPFHSIMYAMMGVGATAIVLGGAVIGWVVKRDGNADLSPVLREGIWLGFLLTFIFQKSGLKPPTSVGKDPTVRRRRSKPLNPSTLVGGGSV